MDSKIFHLNHYFLCATHQTYMKWTSPFCYHLHACVAIPKRILPSGFGTSLECPVVILTLQFCLVHSSSSESVARIPLQKIYTAEDQFP